MSVVTSLTCMSTLFALDGNGTSRSPVGSREVPGAFVVDVVGSDVGKGVVPPGVGATGGDETTAPGDSVAGGSEGPGVLGTEGAAVLGTTGD